MILVLKKKVKHCQLSHSIIFECTHIACYLVVIHLREAVRAYLTAKNTHTLGSKTPNGSERDPKLNTQKQFNRIFLVHQKSRESRFLCKERWALCYLRGSLDFRFKVWHLKTRLHHRSVCDEG